MDNLKPPKKLDFESKNLSDSWKKWKQELLLFVDLSMADETDLQKIKMLKYVIGTQGREIYDTFRFLKDDGTDKPEVERTFDEVVGKYEAYCNPKKNETVERYKFYTRAQGKDETFDKYLTELRILASTCNFGTILDSMLRDRIVVGIADSFLRERLLRESDLTLEKATQLCRASELSKEQSKTIEQPSASVSVHAVKAKTHKETGATAKRKNRKNLKSETSRGPTQSGFSGRKPCKYCGQSHERNKCPAYGKTCNYCKKLNHWEKVCQSKAKQKVHAVQNDNDHSEYDDSSDDCFEIHSMELTNETELPINTITSTNEKQILATMIINETPVKLQVDTGATCNVISSKYLNEHQMANLQQTNQVLTMYNKQSVVPEGKLKLKMLNPRNNKKYRAEFVVIENNNCTPILGINAAQQMELLTIKHENICVSREMEMTLTESSIFDQYDDVFTGVGRLNGEYHLYTDPNVKPVIHAPRRVPVSLKDKLKSELDRLETENIIAKVVEPTKWVSSLVIVETPNKLRICLDPQDLNKALQRSHYPIPTIEEILPDLKNAKVFSVVDAKDGFWHVPLDNESSLLTTFNTPFGRYRWCRMPFGISTASEEFQRRQDEVVEGLPGVLSVVDDIIIYGEGDTEEEAIRDHDSKFRALMERCRERNLKLNRNKLKLKLKELTFIGHLITDKGIEPDPAKVKAVENMPTPKDVTAVKSFLSFVTYLSKFLPKLSDISEPLRQLTRQGVEFVWTESQESAFNEIKRLVTSKPVLRYYDANEELVLQCDSSQNGLGAALLQNGQPIAFASRALTETERRYAQIEKELLAVVFGLEKFHQYTYARDVIVQSDHKPLETITKKPLHEAPTRLQRMLLRISKYNIALQYYPGRKMFIADTLSRAFLDNENETECADLENTDVVNHINISVDRLKDIRDETAKDSVLQTLEEVIVSGWPNNIKHVKHEIQPYFHIRDELTVENGIIFKGNRAVIPESLRIDMIQRIHSSHIGREGCLRRARDTIYWPNMNKHVKDYISKCAVCRKHDIRQGKETLMMHDIPLRPWEKIGLDLFTFDDKDYLITVDYFSNFFEIDYLKDTKSKTVVNKLKYQFARYGIPDTCMSDNGPQFTSETFKHFSKTWKFNHVTSSPLYPQSNGKVENAVKSAKRIMKKAKDSQSDPYLALLDFRNTPTQGMKTSPVQRLMNRRSKTMLPITDKLLKPDNVNLQTARNEIQKNKYNQETYYNKSAKDLAPLKPGDVVRIQPSQSIGSGGDWEKGVISKTVQKRSYEVRTDRGIYRRNRRHLRKSNEDVQGNEFMQDGKYDFDIVTESNQETGTENRNTQETESKTVETRTRSGREIRKPAYLKDYDCS